MTPAPDVVASSGTWCNLIELLDLVSPPERSHQPALMGADPGSGEGILTHGRLRETLASFSLTAFGIRPGDRVAVALDAGPELALAVLSVCSRACCVPLNPKVGFSTFPKSFLPDVERQASLVGGASMRPLERACLHMHT